jgi:hypothetical protein
MFKTNFNQHTDRKPVLLVSIFKYKLPQTIDLKYLTAYLVPVICILGIANAGWRLYLTPLVVFGMVPLLELWTPSLKTNLDEDQRQSKLYNRFFDVSPQLPHGCPTIVIIALFPPLWFALVNKQVPLEMVKLQTAA